VKPISLPAKIATMRTHQRRYETFAVEPRDAHLLAMIDRVEACLRVARMLARRGRAARPRTRGRRARPQGPRRGTRGTLGYLLLVARREQ
jgi:hypothetical protein